MIGYLRLSSCIIKLAEIQTDLNLSQGIRTGVYLDLSKISVEVIVAKGN